MKLHLHSWCCINVWCCRYCRHCCFIVVLVLTFLLLIPSFLLLLPLLLLYHLPSSSSSWLCYVCCWFCCKTNILSFSYQICKVIKRTFKMYIDSLTEAWRICRLLKEDSKLKCFLVTWTATSTSKAPVKVNWENHIFFLSFFLFSLICFYI